MDSAISSQAFLSIKLLDTHTHRRPQALALTFTWICEELTTMFFFFRTEDSVLLSSADTTFTTAHTYVVTFQALPSPSRVCGVSFVTVMSSSE